MQLLVWAAGNRPLRDCNAASVQVQAATAFLSRAHPLNYVAPIRKSSVQHAFCDMLIAILGVCVKADSPRYQANGLTKPIDTVSTAGVLLHDVQ